MNKILNATFFVILGSFLISCASSVDFQSTPASKVSGTLSAPFGKIEIPDGFMEIDKPSTYKVESGVIMYTPKTAFGRSMIIITYEKEDPKSGTLNAKDAAVKIANPQNLSLTEADAKSVLIGGVEGGRYDWIQPNGLRVTGLAASNNNYRVVVMLKGPTGSPYGQLLNQFSYSIEHLSWAK